MAADTLGGLLVTFAGELRRSRLSVYESNRNLGEISGSDHPSVASLLNSRAALKEKQVRIKISESIICESCYVSGTLPYIAHF